ncbi:hypothetical protein NST45_17635 [Paenibacillus sp. FSL R7-0163]|uniref:hypothetical protein n=1 Tax=unclassified Paenibacillus TaxID=185978 RepID=UPI00096F1EF6|nr:hypothetical protein BJP47_30365 [Paenibacillus odorifer]
MLIFSWFLIFLGLVIPGIVLFCLKKIDVMKILFFCSSLIGLYLTSIGVLKNSWISTKSGEFMGWTVLTFSMIEATMIIIYLIYFACSRGVKYLRSDNPWSKMGKSYDVAIQLIMICIFLILPNVMFSLLYSLWSIVVQVNSSLGLYDFMFYAFSIKYSLPLTGLFIDFQHNVNSFGILRFLQVFHIFTTTLIEFVVIGFIIARLNNLMKDEELPQNQRRRYRRRIS